MNYGAKIKSRRISQGWTQSELAERCGVTLRTIQRLEKGEVKPSLFTQVKLQEALGVQFQEEEKEPEFTSNESKYQNFYKRMQTAIPFLSSSRLAWAGIIALALGSLLWTSQKQDLFTENGSSNFISNELEI